MANRHEPAANWWPAPVACRLMSAHVPPRSCRPPRPNRTGVCGGVVPHASTGHRTLRPPLHSLRGRHVLSWYLRGRFDRPRHPLRSLQRAAIQGPVAYEGNRPFIRNRSFGDRYGGSSGTHARLSSGRQYQLLPAKASGRHAWRPAARITIERRRLPHCAGWKESPRQICGA